MRWPKATPTPDEQSRGQAGQPTHPVDSRSHFGRDGLARPDQHLNPGPLARTTPSRQRFALIVGEGLVRAVGEITRLSMHGDRVALEGTALGEGHPVHDAYIGKLDPVATGSQNPVGYCDLPEEAPFVLTPAPAAAARPPIGTFCPATRSAPSRPASGRTSAARR